jgi:hypothetical protein
MKIEFETEEKVVTLQITSGTGTETITQTEPDSIDELVSLNEETGLWCYENECIYDSRNEAIKRYTDTIDRKDIKVYNSDFIKSMDEDKRLFKCVVLRPEQYDDDGTNQDYYSKAVVEKGCHDFNMYCQQNNLQHLFNTDLIKVAESFIADLDYSLGNGDILEGDWVMTVKVFDDEIWEMCKDGTFTGFSIGCSGMVEEENE